jgi:AsmA protein
MKIIKRLLAVIMVLVVLLVAVAGFILLTLDLNSYKPQIEEQVQKQTGRTLALKGDIGFSLFPAIALELGEASLGNAPGFGDQPFASIQEVRLNVALLPLLKQRLEVDTIVFDGMSLDLMKRADGSSNWDDLAGEKTAGAAPAEAEDKDAEEDVGTSAPPLDIQVQGLRITNARLSYQDEATGQRIRLDPFNLKAGELAFGKPMPLEMDLRLLEGEATDLTAQLTAMITVDPEPQQYRLDDLKLQASLRSPDAPGGKMDVELQANVAADLAADTATLSGLALRALGLQIDGKLTARQLSEQLSYDGTITLAEFNPVEVMKGLGVEAPQTADPGVLKSMQGSLSLSGTDDSLTISQLTMNLDDSTLKGTASVSQFAKPIVRVDLGLDAINLDRYMAPASDDAGAADAGAAGTGAAAGDDRLDLPVEMLREQDAIASFKISDLIVQKAKLSNAQVKVSARNGVVLVKPFSAQMYGGGFDSTMKMDVSKKTPRFSVSQKLTGVESGPLLKDMFGDNYLSGKANFKLDVDTSGDRVSQLKKALNGALKWPSQMVPSTTPTWPPRSRR